MHMIDVLKELVCIDGFNRISKKMSQDKNWVWIDYFTPGPKLAKKIKIKLEQFSFVPKIYFYKITVLF